MAGVLASRNLHEEIDAAAWKNQWKFCKIMKHQVYVIAVLSLNYLLIRVFCLKELHQLIWRIWNFPRCCEERGIIYWIYLTLRIPEATHGLALDSKKHKNAIILLVRWWRLHPGSGVRSKSSTTVDGGCRRGWRTVAANVQLTWREPWNPDWLIRILRMILRNNPYITG